MSTSDSSTIINDFFSWLRSLSNRVESHEHRLDLQTSAISAHQDSLNTQSDLSLARHQSTINKIDDLTRSTAEHFNGIATDIAFLRAEVMKLGSTIPPPSPVDPVPVDPIDPTDPTDPTDPVITYNSSVAISVKNYSHVLAPVGSYVTVAVPVPRSLQAYRPEDFSLVFGAVLPVESVAKSELLPCDVRVTARWASPGGPVLDITTSAVRWINVLFPITRDISPSATDTYTLLIGTNQLATPDQLDVIERDSSDPGYDVLVGLTQFSLSYTGLSAYRSGTTLLSSSGTTTNLSPTTESALSRLDNRTLVARDINIEYQGPLTAIIVVEGTLNYGNLFPGPISVRRRYQFYANSPTVHVTQSLTFEGTFNGGSHQRDNETATSTGAKWNAILGNLFRESFKIPDNATATTVLDSVNDAAFVESPDTPISLSQLLRDRRLNLDSSGNKTLNPPRYELLAGGSLTSGPDADGGLLSVSTPTSSVTFALRHMHRYEPQSISFDPSTSTINLDLASDKFRLAHHQGLFVEYSITVSPLTQPDLLSIWRDLNTPLVGLVSPEWVNSSGATWNGIPTYFGLAADERLKLREGYAKSVRAIVDSTLRKRVSEGMQGLLTWGLYPQYWGEWGDFSPSGLGSGLKSWDQTFVESTFTDYWNTCRLSVEGAYALSSPQWINEITYPAALRMLYTQIVQGPPDISLDRVEAEKIGTATYGYSLYRSDGNSSHQYWENLFWYYYLTGDYTVISTIERGARVQLRRFRAGTPVTGRQPMQWMSVFLFLDGTSRSTDIDWNAEFIALMTRSIQEHYLSGPVFDPAIPDGRASSTNTIPYAAIWLEDRNKLIASDTTSIYSFAYYDAEMIYQLYLRTNNTPIKIDAHNHTPSEILINLARTVCTYGFSLLNTPLSDVAGNWARAFRVTYDRTSSRFVSFSVGLQSGNELLYPDDKPALAAFLARAARLSRDPAIITTARNLIHYSFERILGKSAASGAPNAQLRDVPMSKLMGLCTGRLGTGVMEMMKLEEELTTEKSPKP